MHTIRFAKGNLSDRVLALFKVKRDTWPIDSRLAATGVFKFPRKGTSVMPTYRTNIYIYIYIYINITIAFSIAFCFENIPLLLGMSWFNVYALVSMSHCDLAHQ